MAVVAILACQACSSSEDTTIAHEGDPQVPGDDCVIARGDGFVIDRGEAEALRRRFAPPPSIEQASRLALDVWLAEWITTGEIERLPLRQKVLEHNRFATRSVDERRIALAEARAHLRVELGPCWPAPERDASSSPPPRPSLTTAVSASVGPLP